MIHIKFDMCVKKIFKRCSYVNFLVGIVVISYKLCLEIYCKPSVFGLDLCPIQKSKFDIYSSLAQRT